LWSAELRRIEGAAVIQQGIAVLLLGPLVLMLLLLLLLLRLLLRLRLLGPHVHLL
jgi:hypothetical protein